ncbi:MAG TPA: hypothetical protein VK779_04920, partial [Rhizomicrobium sp.]|nr:hypothetical protein [Rhizomicrobium sp.]
EAVKTPAITVPVEQREPLKEECAHFLQSIAAGTVPRTDTQEALRVLSVLEAASTSLRRGQPVAPVIADA